MVLSLNKSKYLSIVLVLTVVAYTACKQPQKEEKAEMNEEYEL